MTDLPFNTPPLDGYLRTYYDGRADLSRLSQAKFVVDKCDDCGLVYQRYVPAGRLLTDLYDVWIPSEERDRLRQSYNLDSYRYMAAQVEFLIQHFGEVPARIEVFDFGLGWAEWAAMARGFGCNVAGAELSQERIAHARSIGIPVIPWDEIPRHQFHFINTEQVFEHLVSPLETLQHLVAALRPRGVIKISVPDGRRVAGWLRSNPKPATWQNDEVLMPIAPLEHINCFTYESLTQLGRTVGLQPLRPDLYKLYNSNSGWLNPKNALRDFLRPLYRHIYPGSTFLYFEKPSPP